MRSASMDARTEGCAAAASDSVSCRCRADVAVPGVFPRRTALEDR